MICHAARDLLSDLVDGALPAEDRRDLEAHLATCGECARELDALRQTVALLHRVEPARAPVGFVDRVMEQAAPRPWLRRVLADLLVPIGARLPAGAAAVAMVAIGVVYVFNQTPELQQAARREVPGEWGEAARAPAAHPLARSTGSSPEPAAAPAAPPAAPPPVAARSGPPETSVAPLARGAPEAERRDQPEPQKSERTALPDRPVPVAPPLAASPGARDVAAPAEGSAPTSGADFRAEPTRRRAADAPGNATAAAPPRAETSPAPPVLSRQGQETPAAPVPRVSDPRSSSPPAREAAVERESGPRAARMLVPPDVSGRLLPRDRASLPSALAAVVAGAGGLEAARRAEGGDLVVEVIVPRVAYLDFARGVAALGEWVVGQEPASLPSTVRVLIRIAP